MMKKIKLHHQGILICSIVVLLLLCVIVNMVVEIFSRSNSVRFDMTDNQLYQLSNTTRDIVQSTVKHTQITVCSSKEDFWIVGVELLERYQALSDKLSVSYIDPYTQPVIVEGYRSKGVDLEQFDILIEQGENYKVLALDQLYVADAAGEKIQNICAEQMITSAIYHMETQKRETVLFTAGHNETPTKALYSIFTENGYLVRDASISLEEIGADKAMVVIANPARDFSKDEINRLEQYFGGGGKILVFLGASTQVLPLLTSFLERYSILPEPYVVLDDALYADNNYLNVIGVFTKHKLNEYFFTNQYYPVLPQSRLLKVAEYPQSNLSVSELVYSADSSYCKAFSELTDIAKKESDQSGPFVLSAIAEKKVGSNTAMLIVMGSGYIYADDLMQAPTYANREYIMQMINYCTPNDVMLNIPAKQLAPDPIVVLESHLIVIGLTVLIIAASVLICGWVILSRRRSL